MINLFYYYKGCACVIVELCFHGMKQPCFKSDGQVHVRGLYAAAEHALTLKRGSRNEKHLGMSPPPTGAGPSPSGRPVCGAASPGWTRPFSATESLSAGLLWLPPPPCPRRPANQSRTQRDGVRTQRV